MSGTDNTPATSEDVSQPTTAAAIVTKFDIDNQKERDFPILSAQERGFALEYINNGYNHRAAAEGVGLSATSGIALKRRPYIAAYISFLQELMYESNVVIKGFIDAKLDDLYDMAVGDVEVPLVTGDGSSFTAKKFQGGLALQIIQERSKTHGIVKDEKVANNAVIVNIDLGMALGEKNESGQVITGRIVND